ncbi:dTMP kinase [Methanolobus chelungpuianus]|uniref:Probable thymidylate kinase n=1 Tax=Methanolobus chelungpuianus TaxID=502115 RepID=A0AAE3KX60_9EURY|nr:dTMP kinase [Methanolobus chelungpuianus]MCQ6961924.1 thymidylate kinase [Methanolobus chelungpuianus]
MPAKGKLITLEGIDGSGKSTIARSLASNPEFSDFVFTREPTGSWIGEAVNRAIHSDTDHLAELFLFVADHAEHVSKLILPSLESGRNVISDRYSASRYAYQGMTLQDRFGDSLRWIQDIHKGWTVVPDLTILFDIDPDIAVARCGSRGDKTKFEKVTFLEGVRSNYLRLADESPSSFVVIDANRSVEEIGSDVVGIISSLV